MGERTQQDSKRTDRQPGVPVFHCVGERNNIPTYTTNSDRWNAGICILRPNIARIWRQCSLTLVYFETIHRFIARKKLIVKVVVKTSDATTRSLNTVDYRLGCKSRNRKFDSVTLIYSARTFGWDFIDRWPISVWPVLVGR